MSLYDLHQKRGVLLTISGLPIRYYLGVRPSPTNCPGTGSNYIDIELLESVDEWSESIKPWGGVAEYGSVGVVLGSRLDLGDEFDPINVLCKVGSSESSWSGYLSGSLLATQHSLSLKTASPTSLAGKLLHIGSETIRVTVDSGTTLTIERGVARTTAQAHLVQPGFESYPVVTKDLCFFKGRQAWISLTDGDPSGYKEVYWGEIEDSPRREGNQVSFSLISILSLLDADLPETSEEVGLARGVHYFESGVGDTFSYSVDCAKGCLDFLDSVDSISGSTIICADATEFGPLYLVTDTSLAPNHPRCPKIYKGSYYQHPERVTGYSTPGYVCASPLQGTWSAGDAVEWLGGVELFCCTIPSGLQSWPECLQGAIASRCSFATAQGLGGGWVRCSLALGASPALVFSPASRDAVLKEPYLVTVRTKSTNDQILRGYEWLSGAPTRPTVGSELYAPISIESNPVAVKWNYRLTRVGLGIADCWYQAGEKYLLIESPPSGAPPIVFPVVSPSIAAVQIWDENDDQTKWTVRVTESVALSTPSGTVYRLTLHDDDRYDLPSLTGPNIRIEQALVSQPKAYWRDFLLNLLVSPAPGGLYAQGLGLPLVSVLPHGEDGDLGVGNWSSLGDTVKPKELLEACCKLTLQGIVIRPSVSGLIIDLQNLSGGDTVLTLSPSNVLATNDGILESIDDELINQLKLTFADDQGTITINNRDSQQRSGSTESLELNLPAFGPASDQNAVSRWVPQASRIFAQASSPRRVLTIAIPTGTALGLYLGAQVQVDVLGYSTAPKGAVVVGLTVNPMSHESSVTVSCSNGYEVVGWNDNESPEEYLAHYDAGDFIS